MWAYSFFWSDVQVLTTDRLNTLPSFGGLAISIAKAQVLDDYKHCLLAKSSLAFITT